MSCPEGRTKDGFETQFGTNHLAHFLLFQLLRPTLLASSSPSFQSRVVMLSSSAHNFCPVQLGDYDLKMRGYDPWMSYGQSKTANIWMANEIERRYASQGLHGLSVHPGSIQSGLQKHLTPESMGSALKMLGLTMAQLRTSTRYKSAAQGAATTMWAAAAKEWEGKGGLFLEDCSVAGPRQEDKPFGGYSPHAYDVDGAQRLWVDSCAMVGVADELTSSSA
jgi:NAD(P)-dependent dehydrogenase (short-subunit alcohol dehydrogenase family)